MENSGVHRNGYSTFTTVAVLFVSIFTGATAAFAEGAITVIPDASVFVQIVNFILLIILLNMVLYKPIRGILTQRKEKIEGLEEVIKSSEEGVKEKEEAFTTGIREARSKGVALKDAIVEEATQEEKKILAEINDNAQADLAEVREKIAKDVDGVRKTLQKEVDAFAGAICEKILGRAM